MDHSNHTQSNKNPGTQGSSLGMDLSLATGSCDPNVPNKNHWIHTGVRIHIWILVWTLLAVDYLVMN